ALPMAAAAPAPPAVGGPPPPGADLRVFRSPAGAHLFVADGSRIYDLDDSTADRIARWLDAGGTAPDGIAPVLDLLPGAGRPRRGGGGRGRSGAGAGGARGRGARGGGRGRAAGGRGGGAGGRGERDGARGRGGPPARGGPTTARPPAIDGADGGAMGPLRVIV